MPESKPNPKLQYNLEFELRLQQYIEMVRTGPKERFNDAMIHAKRYLAPYLETQSVEIHRAAGLLAFPPDTKAEPYKVMGILNTLSGKLYKLTHP